MITIDSDPILNPVYIGAAILSELASTDYTEAEIEHLYETIKSKFDVSYEVFTFALDWLYVVGAIDLNSNGCIAYAVV
ncbi:MULTISPECIES: ABC-three component system middle component 6 [Pseudomonas]|uniref:ABC-three component system middle component 6 n=1 Tax=Pseudomonas TaxID=286 RepID=UPI0009997865|nr:MULTISPECIES: ABC-three component system middle component 6 [Pseudomonas]OPB21766.1 hypothetical protein BFW90_20565 [Pseudomonas fluorescens]